MTHDPGSTSTDGEVDDQALMLAYAAGDIAAFDALYLRHKGPVYRFFLRQLDASDAEECHQEVWLKVINARTRYVPSGSFVGYLFTIAHHVLTDRHRKTLRQPPTHDAAEPDDVAAAGGDHVQRLDTQRAHHALCELLTKLPIAQREAWLMHQETGMTLDEIADVTGSNREGVKSRVRYATQKLKAGLQRHVRTA